MREAMGALPLILWTTVMVLCSAGAGAVWINLPRTGAKCVSEEIQANVVVLATYLALYDEDHSENPIDTTATISAKVTSPYGNMLHLEQNVTRGQFAFTASESGTYLACFWLDGVRRDAVATVSLNWRMGIAAKDWDSVAKKQKVEGIELELMKLEEVADEIYDNLLHLRVREAEMRDVSETTNFRVALFSIMSLAICIIVSVFQLWHLKAYFQKKKLI